MTDTEILAWVGAKVRAIDQNNLQIIIVIWTGQSFTGLSIADAVTSAVAAGY